MFFRLFRYKDTETRDGNTEPGLQGNAAAGLRGCEAARLRGTEKFQRRVTYLHYPLPRLATVPPPYGPRAPARLNVPGLSPAFWSPHSFGRPGISMSGLFTVTETFLLRHDTAPVGASVIGTGLRISRHSLT